MGAVGEVEKRVPAGARHQRSTLVRKSGPNDMPGVQPAPKEENGPVPERDGNLGRHRVEMLALRLGRGGVL